MADKKDNTPNLIFLGFADNKRPDFREVPSKEWILFGEDNLFPDHILYLFDKSSVHGAIVNNKVKYIIGNGINPAGLEKINRYGESINKVLEKSCKDIELFGGFYWQVIYDALGRVKELIHTPFQTIRRGKSGGWWHCKRWNWNDYKKVEPTFIPDFDVNKPSGVQLFAFKEYRPGAEEYPLPGYFSGLNDIETDAEISIYNLSVMKNGQFTGKLISFFNGYIEDEEKKKKLEKDWNRKFNGASNAGKTMLAFNNPTDKEPVVSDLSSTDLDKLFDQLRKSTEQKIFASHEVTSPVLFGIMQPGSLGNRTEMQDSFEIFKNTYANAKQMAIEEVLALFLPLFGKPMQKIIPVSPIGGAQPGTTSSANENVKNLTGRQHQQVLRIIRQFGQGKISKEQAAVLLRTSLGLQDEEINVLLATDEQFEKVHTEEEVAEMFTEIGQSREEFTIVKAKKFSRDDTDFIQNFADVKGNDSSILDLIKKDKKITAEVIAKTLDIAKSYVEKRIKILEERGVLVSKTSKIGIDTIIEHSINQDNIDKIDKPETVDVYIKYSYEVKPNVGPEIIPGTRPFCKRLIELDRLYTRAEIELITQRVGYSVWDRKGGFWNNGGDIEHECRHEWKHNIVIKKRK